MNSNCGREDEQMSEQVAGGQSRGRLILFRSLRSGFWFSEVAGSRCLHYNVD